MIPLKNPPPVSMQKLAGPAPSYLKIASISPTITPCNLITLCRDLCPRTSSTCPRPQPNLPASNRTNASFAVASTGGAVTLIFNSPPSGSPISSRQARGCSFTDSRKPSGCARKNPGNARNGPAGIASDIFCLLPVTHSVYPVRNHPQSSNFLQTNPCSCANY